MTSAEDRAAVLDEVRLIVVEAIREGDPVRADQLAKIVAYSYPHSGLSILEIADRIKATAFVAGVSVEPWRRCVHSSVMPDWYLGAAIATKSVDSRVSL